MCLVFGAEVFQGGHDRARCTVAERTEGLAQHNVRDIEKFVQVFGFTVAGLKSLENTHQPVGALTTGSALAAGFVRVEFGPSQYRAHHTRGVVEYL
ncbi:Uncharacterised protein [Mycobacteroides abscessus subsp. abscessus]|nr:Uncharacterised protein [Mycobacteroides abscessus subsp. abscessus]